MPAHWASWADSPRMIHHRHPEVANTMIRNRSGRSCLLRGTPCRWLHSTRIGGHCPLLSLKPSLTVSLESLASLPKGGNVTRLRALRNSFVTRRCSLGALLESVLCFVHKGEHWRLSLCTVVPTCTLRCFDPGAFFLRRTSPSSSPLPTLAGVAVHSTALAITVQVVRGQVCWGGVVSLWSQQLHGFAVRLERESQRTFSFGTCT